MRDADGGESDRLDRPGPGGSVRSEYRGKPLPAGIPGPDCRAGAGSDPKARYVNPDSGALPPVETKRGREVHSSLDRGYDDQPELTRNPYIRASAGEHREETGTGNGRACSPDSSCQTAGLQDLRKIHPTWKSNFAQN